MRPSSRLQPPPAPPIIDPRRLPFRARLRLLSLPQALALVVFVGGVLPVLILVVGIGLLGVWDALFGGSASFSGLAHPSAP